MYPEVSNPAGNPPVDSAAFRRRAVHVQLSEDPDTATVQTAQEMCRQISAAARDPLVQACARRAVAAFQGGPAWWFLGASSNPVRQQQRMAESCFWWCKHYLKFVHHGNMFELWASDLGDPANKMQLLISPDVLVRMRRMEGDCAIYTMMLCAMLRALGIGYQICPAAVDHTQPEIFSHVFARAVFADGSTESLDASHGPRPGWQVPKEDLLRIWCFDEAGRQVSPGRGFSGLHAYRRSGRRRGLGDGEADDIQEGGTYVPPPPSPSMDWSGVPFDSSQGGFPAPSQNSTQWAAFASNLAKMGFTLAQINAIQPGTVVSANGAILRQNPGYSVPVGTAAPLNLGSGSSILYIGLGLGALVLVASMFKGGR